MLRCSLKFPPSLSKTTVLTISSSAASTTALLFNQARFIKMVPRKSLQNKFSSSTINSSNNKKQTLAKPTIAAESVTIESTIPTSTEQQLPKTTTTSETMKPIETENTTNNKQADAPPEITMPSANNTTTLSSTMKNFHRSTTKKSNSPATSSSALESSQQEQRPLHRLQYLIRSRIEEQERFEENQRNEASSSSPTKFNRYSSLNFGHFSSTAEEIILEFRRTFKLPSSSNKNISNDNNTTTGQQQAKSLLLTEGTDNSNNNNTDTTDQLVPLSQHPPHQHKKVKLFPSKPFGGSMNNNNNTNKDLVPSSSSSQQHVESGDNNNNNANNKFSYTDGILARYCGTPSDVLQLAMIVMQSCVDVCEIDTARLMFALVLQEVPFELIPVKFFRLYFLALSRSETVTLEEFNGLVTLVGGRETIRRSSVMSLCVIEVKLRCGFSVSLQELQEAISADANNNDNKDDDSSTSLTKKQQQPFFMMTEESEKRLKLRDCFLMSLRNHPDPEIPTLLLREWTKLSELNEFAGEMNTIVHFLLIVTNNNAAPASLCAELVSLLEGLAKSNQENTNISANNNNNNNNRDFGTKEDHGDDDGANNNESSSSDEKKSAAELAVKEHVKSLVTLKTILKCASKAIRSEDWKSFLTIERFISTNYLSKEDIDNAAAASIISKSSESEQQQQQEQQNQQQQPKTSPASLSVIISSFAILRIVALIETNQYEKIFAANKNNSNETENLSDNKNIDDDDLQNASLLRSANIAPLLFAFRQRKDLDSNVCPFFLDQLVTTSNKKGKRIEIAKLVNFPFSELPPMTYLFERIVGSVSNNNNNNSSSSSSSPRKQLLEAWNLTINNKEEDSSSSLSTSVPAFLSALTLLSCSVYERASSGSSSKNQKRSSSISSSSSETVTRIIEHYFSSVEKTLMLMSLMNKNNTTKQQITFMTKLHPPILNLALNYLSLISSSAVADNETDDKKEFEDLADFLVFEVLGKYLSVVPSESDNNNNNNEVSTMMKELRETFSKDLDRILKRVTGKDISVLEEVQK